MHGQDKLHGTTPHDIDIQNIDPKFEHRGFSMYVADGLAQAWLVRKAEQDGTLRRDKHGLSIESKEAIAAMFKKERKKYENKAKAWEACKYVRIRFLAENMY